MAAYAIRIEGLKDVQRRLRAEHLYAEPLREALREAGTIAQNEAIKSAPVETGRLKSRIRLTVSKAPVPRSAIVRANVSKRRFRYPWALDTSKRVRFTFRSTGRRGQLTYRWFRSARDKVSPRVNEIVSRAARRIEARWQT